VARGLQISANYTWSKTMELTGGGFKDIYNARADIGLSGIHRTHVANIAYVYEIPFFRKDPRKWLRNTLGGWDLSGITSFQSGAPTPVTVPADVARNGSSSSRATVVASPNLDSSARTLTRWFNTEAFLDPANWQDGAYGTAFDGFSEQARAEAEADIDVLTAGTGAGELSAITPMPSTVKTKVLLSPDGVPTSVVGIVKF